MTGRCFTPPGLATARRTGGARRAVPPRAESSAAQLQPLVAPQFSSIGDHRLRLEPSDESAPPRDQLSLPVDDALPHRLGSRVAPAQLPPGLRRAVVEVGFRNVHCLTREDSRKAERALQGLE